MNFKDAVKEMKDVTFDNAVYFDCDDTLIMWAYDQEHDSKTVDIVDEYGISNRVLPHLYHIEKVKKHFEADHKVYIWSQGGEDWALRVTAALGLQDHVTDVLCKPELYYDDVHSDMFLGKPQYLDPYTGEPSFPFDEEKKNRDNNELVRKFFTGWKQNREEIRILETALKEISVLARFTDGGTGDAILDVIDKAFDGEDNSEQSG